MDTDDTDMRIEPVAGEVGLRSITITAFTEAAEIDLEMEYPRIIKLLSRDWMEESQP